MSPNCVQEWTARTYYRSAVQNLQFRRPFGDVLDPLTSLPHQDYHRECHTSLPGGPEGSSNYRVDGSIPVAGDDNTWDKISRTQGYRIPPTSFSQLDFIEQQEPVPMKQRT